LVERYRTNGRVDLTPRVEKHLESTNGSKRYHKFLSNTSQQLVLLIEQEKKIKGGSKREEKKEKEEGCISGSWDRGGASGHEVSLVTAGIENIRARP